MSGTKPTFIRGALLAALVALSSCSLVFMERAPTLPEPGAPSTCSKDKEIPWWDVVLASASGAIGVGTMVAAAGGGGDRSSRLTVGTIMLGLGAAYAYSAYRGFAWVKECRADEGG